MSKITLKIDNKEVTVDQGSTILQAATEAGIVIPTLCYNEKISKTTSCFVCVVKDAKNGRYIPSCSAKAAEGMEIEASSDAVKDMRKTALELLLSEHIGDCEAPCTIACPAHAKVEEYVRAGKSGDFRKALEIIKMRIPLPMSIGRVCPRFCEKDCRRNVDDLPVAINDFKRTAADLEYENYMEPMEGLGDKKVAIVGAGPGGIAVAYFLRKAGVASDIFDMKDKPGGMLRYGIPEYRLPKDILDKEIAHFDKMGGIKFHMNKKLGVDIKLDDLKKDYDAVAIAVGSWKPSSSRIEGEVLTIGGIQFLEKLADNDWKGENPGKTIVIGGGNTAMDCLRTSVRLGSDEVICAYRRTEKEMPAEDIEIHEAKEEGVQFKFLTQPIACREENGKKILTCLKMELGEPDASGRRRPIPIEGSEFELEADTVIGAIGQKTVAPEGTHRNRWGDIDVEEAHNFMGDNVFAAGDCVTGPATVVEAVAGGRIAAMGILSYFKGERYEEPYEIHVSRGHWNHLKKDDLVFVGDPEKYNRVPQELIPIDERKTTFKEVSRTFSVEEIAKEGERCYECSCTDKDDCALRQYSEKYRADLEKFKGRKKEVKVDTRHPKIIMDPGKCIKCETCIKISREIINSSIFGFKNRGFETIMGTAFDQPIAGTEEELRLYVENCPTGALDWKKKEE
ncbi:MAG: FAD-dependent oxidoreductase [Candidatus Zixiibacteriota bacterium]